MKFAAGIIILNSDFLLRQLLESIYPHFDQILVSEGPVKYWQDAKGITTSTDRTNGILDAFPDPDNKITIVHGQFSEKTEQANAYMQHMKPDIDYIWNIDADEFFMQQDYKRIQQLVADGQYTSAGFKSYTFFGGLNHHLTGFEEDHEFLRIRKVYPGSRWKDHRPPTIEHAAGTNALPEKHLSYNTLAEMGIRMYHYSYVFPRQVKEKVAYYEAAVIAKGKCIPDYYKNVWLSWVKNPDQRQAIEAQYKGVHEFTPDYRGECFTAPFTGTHPVIIQRDRKLIEIVIKIQLEAVTG